MASNNQMFGTLSSFPLGSATTPPASKSDQGFYHFDPGETLALAPVTVDFDAAFVGATYVSIENPYDVYVRAEFTDENGDTCARVIPPCRGVSMTIAPGASQFDNVVLTPVEKAAPGALASDAAAWTAITAVTEALPVDQCLIVDFAGESEA